MDLLEEPVCGSVSQMASRSTLAQGKVSRPEHLRSLARIQAPVRGFLRTGELERAEAYIERRERDRARAGAPFFMSRNWTAKLPKCAPSSTRG